MGRVAVRPLCLVLALRSLATKPLGSCWGQQLGKPGRDPEAVGSRIELLTGLFLGRDSDLQSIRPRAETKPAEELRSWDKKQRAPLRYSGQGRGPGSPGHLSTVKRQLCTCV